MAKIAKYIGTATIRQITHREWILAGVANQKTVRWSADNGFTLSQSDFTEPAWGKLEADDGIVIIDVGVDS